MLVDITIISDLKMAAYPNQTNNPPQTMGSTNTVFLTETRFDPSYIKTPPGIMKIVVIVSFLYLTYYDYVLQVFSSRVTQLN